MKRSSRADHGSSYPPRVIDRYVSNNSDHSSQPQPSAQPQYRSRSRSRGRQFIKRRKTEVRSSSATDSCATRFEIEYLRKKVDVLLETVSQLNEKVDHLLDILSKDELENGSLTQSSTHRARENETGVVPTSREVVNVLQQPERQQNGATLSNCLSGHIMNMKGKQLLSSSGEQGDGIGGLDDYKQRTYVNRELGINVSHKCICRINETLVASTNRGPGPSVPNNPFHSIIEAITAPGVDATRHFQDENSLFSVSGITVKTPNITTRVSHNSRWDGNKDFGRANPQQPFLSEFTRYALNVPALGMTSPSTLNITEAPDPARLDNPTKCSCAKTTMASYTWSDDFIPFEG